MNCNYYSSLKFRWKWPVLKIKLNIKVNISLILVAVFFMLLDADKESSVPEFFKARIKNFSRKKLGCLG